MFQISEEIKQDLKRIAPYRLQHTHEDEVSARLNENIRLAEEQGVLHRDGISMPGNGHTVSDHRTLLQRGFRSIIDEAKHALTDTDLQDAQRNYYQAVVISLEGALPSFQRSARLVEEMAEHEQDEKRRQELRVIAHMAGTMMEQGARSLYEGVEVCYTVYVLQTIENNRYSFCYGRFDQYMRKLYGQDVERDVLTKDQTLEITTYMFIMNSFCDKVRPYGHMKYSQDYLLYFNLVVGGKTPQGSNGTDELSRLCIEAMHLISLAGSNFSVCHHLETPRQFPKTTALLIRTGYGMPNTFNDEVVAKGIENLAMPKEDALDYYPIGYVETGAPGKYGHRVTGMTYINQGKVLEILPHNGVDPADGIQILPVNGQDGDTVTFESHEELWQDWEKLLKFYSDISVEYDAIYDDSLAKYDADPLVSCSMQNSMKLGRILKESGYRYGAISQSSIEPCVVGNILYAVRKLVFEEQSVTQGELTTAMQDDWQSLESARIYKKIHHVAKFGNDDDAVDEIVKGVFDSYLKLLPQCRTQRHQQGPVVSCYTMSTSSITFYVPNGFTVGITPGGRFAGVSLNEGYSPAQGTDTNGPTVVINSVAKLPNEQVAAGQLLNTRFSNGVLIGEENLDKFAGFLMASAKKHIYHDRFNVIDSVTLCLTQGHPQGYTDLIMHVASYCAQFVSLVLEAQEAIIARTENTW